MPEKSAEETGDFVLAHRQIDHAVVRVTESLLMEVVIACKKRGSWQLMEQHDDSVIGEPLVSHLDADLAHWDSPTAQELPLMLRDVLIEQVHPATSVGSWINQASRAKRTASAMASLLMSPRQSSTITSQAVPLATCSRTSATRMRVPTNVGFP